MCIKCGVAKCEMAYQERLIRTVGGSRCGYIANWKVTGASYDPTNPGTLSHITISYGKRKKSLKVIEEKEE